MNVKSPKAYNNDTFMKSRNARTVRILCEYLEPEKRLQENGIINTIVFFGSARICPGGSAEANMHKYYDIAEDLAFRLASWSKSMEKPEFTFNICTGGGPGIMEAANRGASRAGEKTIGYNISLPFEQYPNQYITPELNFEFHYFFMRKLWFLYHAKALVVFPGGFGTLDEFFEVLTLKQTKKLEKTDIPILLCDEEFWKDVINFDKLASCGLISPEDVSLFKYFSTAEEGFSYLKSILVPMIKEVQHIVKENDAASRT